MWSNFQNTRVQRNKTLSGAHTNTMVLFGKKLISRIFEFLLYFGSKERNKSKHKMFIGKSEAQECREWLFEIFVEQFGPENKNLFSKFDDMMQTSSIILNFEEVKEVSDKARIFGFILEKCF
jgi:hypothetical protein